MNIKNVKIVADSSADIIDISDISFESAPLKIITSEKEYTDNADLNVEEMIDELLSYKGKSSTSCPNEGDWLTAFGEAQYIFCITISGAVSGSFNSAVLAKQTYEEKYPDRKVFVMDSLSAGPEPALIIEKIKERILQGDDFDTVCREVTAYGKKTGLLFMLESMKNLANNGRVSQVVAKMAGILGVRLVGKASEKGELEPINKCRGEKKALEAIVWHLKEMGLRTGKVKIAHCLNEDAGKRLKKMIESEFKKVNAELYNCRGLCGFYAEKGGLLIGFEKI